MPAPFSNMVGQHDGLDIPVLVLGADMYTPCFCPGAMGPGFKTLKLKM